jgi:NADH:ubiquinone oxidoreductase subunit 3 (subunit A)
MIKKIIAVVIILVSISVVGIIILDSGWVLVPKWYQKTNRSRARSMHSILTGIALSFEQTDIPPPADSIQVLEEKTERWGTPIQYSYENGEATLRSAGKDQKLNTKDDITKKVRITRS